MPNHNKHNRKRTELEGVLEIDHDRGVIYFHTSDEEFGNRVGPTVLRICSLPKPIPRDKTLDVTHMAGVDWAPNKPTIVQHQCTERAVGATLIEVEHREAPFGACNEDSDEVVLHFSNGSEITVYMLHGNVCVEGD